VLTLAISCCDVSILSYTTKTYDPIFSSLSFPPAYKITYYICSVLLYAHGDTTDLFGENDSFSGEEIKKKKVLSCSSGVEEGGLAVPKSSDLDVVPTQLVIIIPALFFLEVTIT
jgi:hypothetical protein